MDGCGEEGREEEEEGIFLEVRKALVGVYSRNRLLAPCGRGRRDAELTQPNEHSLAGL